MPATAVRAHGALLRRHTTRRSGPRPRSPFAPMGRSYNGTPPVGAGHARDHRRGILPHYPKTTMSLLHGDIAITHKRLDHHDQHLELTAP